MTAEHPSHVVTDHYVPPGQHSVIVTLPGTLLARLTGHPHPERVHDLEVLVRHNEGTNHLDVDIREERGRTWLPISLVPNAKVEVRNEGVAVPWQHVE